MLHLLLRSFPKLSMSMSQVTREQDSICWPPSSISIHIFTSFYNIYFNVCVCVCSVRGNLLNPHMVYNYVYIYTMYICEGVVYMLNEFMYAPHTYRTGFINHKTRAALRSTHMHASTVYGTCGSNSSRIRT